MDDLKGLCPIHHWTDEDGVTRGRGVFLDGESYCIVCGLALDGSGEYHPTYTDNYQNDFWDAT